MRISKMALFFATVVFTASVVPAAAAQPYPSKPVRIVVPFPPGGGVDILIRAVADALGAKWRQSVIVENKTGAGGLIGAELVARAPDDGYTLLATTNPLITSSRFLYKSLPFDPDRSFVPLVLLAGADQILVASTAVNGSNLSDIVNLAKMKTGKIAYGTDGNGSKPHQIYGMLSAVKKLDTTHVAYRGIAPAITALMGNEVQLSAASTGVVGPFLKAGKIKALAVAGPKRLSMFPDVPTTAEQGFPELKSQIFYGLFAPAGLSKEVANIIASDVIEILKQPQFIERNATARGLEMIAGGPSQLAAAIQDDVISSGAMIRAAGIKPE